MNKLQKRLNANELCELRAEIVRDLTRALSILGDADSKLKTVSNYGFNISDHRTFSSLSDATSNANAVKELTKQVDRKFWSRIIELGEFRELMSVKASRKLCDDLEDCPPVTFENVSATMSSLLAERPNQLRDLIETAFLERDKKFQSNRGSKINKRQVIDGVYCQFGHPNYGRAACHRLDDIVKAIGLITGLEKPHILEILQKESEYTAFGGAVTFKAFKKGSVHVIIEDPIVLDRLNEVLAGAMPDSLSAA